jgi:hypothetical protein
VKYPPPKLPDPVKQDELHATEDDWQAVQTLPEFK